MMTGGSNEEYDANRESMRKECSASRKGCVEKLIKYYNGLSNLKSKIRMPYSADEISRYAEKTQIQPNSRLRRPTEHPASEFSF